MKIAVTGRQGQVARSLAELSARLSDVELVFLSRPEFDLTKPDTIRRALASVQPDVVISAAAYTAVDSAEDEPDLAYAVNAQGPGELAGAAEELDVPVIHISTDYVFDGDKEQPYSEVDRPAPRSVYGSSKLAGEEAVANANSRHVILRTAWVYSPFGKNFVKTMLRLAAERDEISVVDDQRGNPTSALDIADAVLHVAATKAGSAEHTGVFHLVGGGEASWATFARHVMEVSKAHGGPSAIIRPIGTDAYPTKAPRPANSCLESRKFSSAFGWDLPPWEHSVEHVVQRLLSDAQSF